MTDSINKIDEVFYNASREIYGIISKDLSFISNNYTESSIDIFNNLLQLSVQKLGSIITYNIFKCVHNCKTIDYFLIKDISKKVNKEINGFLSDEFPSSVFSYDFYDLRYDNTKLLTKLLYHTGILITGTYDEILKVLPGEFKRISREDNFRSTFEQILYILILLVFKINHFGKDFNPYPTSLGLINLDGLLDVDYYKIHKFYSQCKNRSKCRKEEELIQEMTPLNLKEQ